MTSKEEIERIVNNLVKDFKTRNPFEIAENLGINIRLYNLGSLKGLYTVQNEYPYILINNQLDYITSKIICAHELGHDRLHQNLANGHILDEYEMYIVNTKTEFEANFFACALLIPTGDLCDLCKKENICTIEEAASILEVTEDLLRIKIDFMRKK